MASDSFFERNYVWQVYFEALGEQAHITLTQRRAYADGSGRKFDEDPQIIDGRTLDLLHDEDDRFIMDGFLALIPDNRLLSCAIQVLRRRLLIWEFEDYDYIFAGFDKHIIQRAFDGRLFNTDGTNGDILFIGGERTAHETATIKEWSKAIEHDIFRKVGNVPGAAWEPVLDVYEAVSYTLSTEIHLRMRHDHDRIEESRMALARVATRYGFVLPPE